MLFKFPQKKIVLDCFTTKSYAVEYAPINFAIKHIPDWWKNLPTSFVSDKNQFTEHGTMKGCVGMVDYYKKSIAVPLWSDLSIKIFQDKTFAWQFSDGETAAVQHPIKKQATGFLNSYEHLKIDSPWLFKSEKDIYWLWSHPTYNYAHSNDICSIPGITSFYHQHATNINIMINVEKEKKILIPQGKPMTLITPMSDRKVEIVRHLIGVEEFIKLRDRSTTIKFISKYKEIIKRRKQFADCPYHKGK